MARYPLGQDVSLAITVQDPAGASVDADGGITLTLTEPDATTVVYTTPTHDSLGNYHQVVPHTATTLVGHYQWVSVAIAGGSQGVGFGEFDVFDPSEVSVLSLADGKAALRITTTANDSKILRKIASIEADIERVIGGPIVTRQVTERVELSAGYTALVLRKRPIVSVVSITSVASGGALSITDIDIDPVANIVRRKLGWPFYGPYFQPLPAMTVVYNAGLGTSVPPSIADAAENILQTQWAATQRGAMLPGGAGQQEVVLPGMTYAISYWAAEKLAPYTLEAYV